MRHWLFDLDETLYPRSASVLRTIGQRIRQFIGAEYHLDAAEADSLARSYHQRYGTSLRGLMLHRQLDPEPYLHYVHDFPLDELMLWPELDALLSALPGEKSIFTNASRVHAERVLARLGIRRHFARIVDIASVGYISKPDPVAYAACLRLVNARAEDCVLVEDMGRNLLPARALGMTTVLVDGDPNDDADYHIPTILDLGPVARAILGNAAS